MIEAAVAVHVPDAIDAVTRVVQAVRRESEQGR
jgi:hypothetical protein